MSAAASNDVEADGTVSRAHRLDASPDNQTRCARLCRMLRSRLFWAKFWLVATGVWWGVCMQLLFYQGAGHPLAALPNLDWYIGMMCVYAGRLCTPRSSYAHYAKIKQVHVLPIAVCDFLGTAGTTVGLELAGSAIFGIIYSSVTVWTALFTCVILKKAQTAVKMAGIATVVAGLTLPTLDSQEDAGEDKAHGRLVLLGIMLTFGGTLFYALEYTLCERAFTLYDKPVDAKELCFQTGAWGFAFTAAWMCAYTFPMWDELVASQVAARAGSIPLILLLFATHTVNNAVHNAAWFVVCELESGVSTGLLMGVKAAALFLASALCFCDDEHREQCMTPKKSLATAVVLCGTAVYYWPGDPCEGGIARWLECWRMPRRTSTAPLRISVGRRGGGGGAELNGAGAGGGGAGGGAEPAEVGSVPEEGPQSPQSHSHLPKRKWRRQRKGGHARLEEEPESPRGEGGEQGADFAAAAAADAARGDGGSAAGDDDGSDGDDDDAAAGDGGAGARSAACGSATPGPTASAYACARVGASPKLNGTPAPLGTPNDDCCRTPLEPTSAASSRDTPSPNGRHAPASAAAARLSPRGGAAGTPAFGTPSPPLNGSASDGASALD